MSLSEEEQRALDLIERELRRCDPVLADRLDRAPTQAVRRQRLAWAHGTMWAGLVIMVAGLAAARGFVSIGSGVCVYGMLIVLASLGVAWRNRTRPARRPPHWRSTTS